MKVRKIGMSFGFFLLALFAVAIGLYPIRFIGLDHSQSLLGSKSSELLESHFYLFSFYIHIFLGGCALLTGFSQFFKRWRDKRLTWHRNLGKIYVVSVLLSGLTGLIIAIFAEGGWVSSTGFLFLSMGWLYTTIQAYFSIRKKNITEHQQWMVRSYALCFAAVTLRLYIPLFLGLFDMEFITAYKIIAWLCWIPNLLIAEFFIRRS